MGRDQKRGWKGKAVLDSGVYGLTIPFGKEAREGETR